MIGLVHRVDVEQGAPSGGGDSCERHDFEDLAGMCRLHCFSSLLDVQSKRWFKVYASGSACTRGNFV